MSTTDAREGTASATRTVASVIGGRTLEDAPGGTVSSVNPARKDETVAEVLLGTPARSWRPAGRRGGRREIGRRCRRRYGRRS
jgi:hypothetical protein